MDADELQKEWLSACRSHPDLRAYPPPPESIALVEAVLKRARGESEPPNTVVASLAAGFAARNWSTSAEAVQVQMGLLVRTALGDRAAEPKRAAEVQMLMSKAAARVLEEAWRDRTERDSLTQLRNRRGMEADRDVRVRGAVGCVYVSIDLDGLKKINDDEGHLAGDAHIKKFAGLLPGVVGLPGELYRYAGDEFAIITDDEHEAALGTALRSAVDDADIPAFSWGMAAWPRDSDEFFQVTDLADAAMYEMKKAKKAAAPQPTRRAGDSSE